MSAKIWFEALMLIIAIIGSLALGFSIGKRNAELSAIAPIQVINPDPMPQAIFNVDGGQCWAGNHPIFEQYDPSDQTVKLTITCTAETMNAYLPAIERTQ